MSLTSSYFSKVKHLCSIRRTVCPVWYNPWAQVHLCKEDKNISVRAWSTKAICLYTKAYHQVLHLWEEQDFHHSGEISTCTFFLTEIISACRWSWPSYASCFQYLSSPFTRRYLARYCEQPIDDMWVRLARGCAMEQVRIIKGVDGRAIITRNWSRLCDNSRACRASDMCLCLQC